MPFVSPALKYYFLLLKQHSQKIVTEVERSPEVLQSALCLLCSETSDIGDSVKFSVGLLLGNLTPLLSGSAEAKAVFSPFAKASADNHSHFTEPLSTLNPLVVSPPRNNSQGELEFPLQQTYFTFDQLPEAYQPSKVNSDPQVRSLMHMMSSFFSNSGSDGTLFTAKDSVTRG